MGASPLAATLSPLSLIFNSFCLRCCLRFCLPRLPCAQVWHSSGKTMTKEQFVGMMPNFMKMPPSQKQRCIYESSEICVSHAFNRFPSGDVEGTMMVQMLRNGKCYRVETGSTNIPKDSPNYIAE